MTDARNWELTAKSATSDTWIGLDGASRKAEWVAKRLTSGESAGIQLSFTVFNRGKRRGDLLHAGGLRQVVASKRLCGVLEDIRATGWASTPVEVWFKNGEELPGYRLLVPLGRCSAFGKTFDDETFEVFPVDPTKGWDGSDVFWPEAESHSLMVTDRVKQALLTAGMDRLEFEDPTDPPPF